LMEVKIKATNINVVER